MERLYYNLLFIYNTKKSNVLSFHSRTLYMEKVVNLFFLLPLSLHQFSSVLDHKVHGKRQSGIIINLKFLHILCEKHT